jgi:hypothetical protein
MKRILLLIILVMMATYCLRSREDRFPYRERDVDPQNLPHFLKGGPGKFQTEADALQADVKAKVNKLKAKIVKLRAELKIKLDRQQTELKAKTDKLRAKADTLQAKEPAKADDLRAEADTLQADFRARANTQRAELQAGFQAEVNDLVAETRARVYQDVATPSSDSVDQATRKFSSGMMATKERAKADAIRRLEAEIPEWLSPEIPDSWKPSKGLVRSMIRETTFTPVVKDYGTLYIAELTADTSARRREAIIAEYQRETVQHRMMALGGSLAFVLVCLAAISGYIRADEATKGYYTNRLRMLAAAGVGAAGVVVYRFMV